jgi:purine nucleoside phosphorylase
MNIMLVFIDSSFLPQDEMQTAETPFGQVTYSQVEANNETAVIIHRSNGGNPKAWAYAARTLGATRVVGVIRDGGVERPSLPTNFIEFTEGRPTTFFETTGTGYVQQNPPYCPELSQTLLAAGALVAGNLLLVVEERPDPGVRSWWQSNGVALISTETQPEGALCRELELCYAVLALPETADLMDVLLNIVAYLPAERNCGCDQLLATARKFGKITADWFVNLE